MTKKGFVWCSVVLSLCFPAGYSVKGAAETQAIFPKHMNNVLSSGVEVDADIDIPETAQRDVSTYQGKIRKIDVQRLSSTLLGDSAVQHTEENNQNDEINFMCTYSGENGSKLISVDDTWVSFSTEKFALIRTDFEIETIPDKQTEFDFASKDEADSRIREILKFLDTDIYTEYDCVSMNCEILKEKNLEQFAGLEEVDEFQETINTLKTIPWSEDFDCYCFTYYGAIDGYRMSSEDREINNYFVPGSVIHAVYSKDGIQKLEISNLYVAQKEIEMNPLCTTDTLLEAIDQKYSSIILQGNYKITSMKLEYIADSGGVNGEYILLPVWRCSVRHQYDTKDKISDEIVNVEDESTLLIDAVSGTEIYSGGII